MNIKDIDYEAHPFDFEARSSVLKRGEAIANFIRKNCRPWLKDTRNGNLIAYRGLDVDDPAVAMVVNVRPDRRPLDTEPYWNERINFMLTQIGSKTKRYNSIAVTGRMGLADQFGFTYVVFPVGKFNFTWNPKAYDWAEDMDEYIEDAPLPKGKRRPRGTVSKSYFAPEAIKRWSDIKVDEGLPEAIASGNEIMIRAKQALYVYPEFYTQIVQPLLNKQEPVLGKGIGKYLRKHFYLPKYE